MDVQLRDDVAERADVDLVDARQRSQEGGRGGDLLHQNRAVLRRQIDDFAKPARRGTRISQG